VGSLVGFAGRVVVDALPDVIAPRLAVLFCGINPGMLAAASGHHFAGRANRFWRVIHLAGFTPEEIRPENDHLILQHHCGLTSVVKRPTARADQLSLQDFTSAAAEFERKIERYAPRFVAFLGKAAYAALSGQRDVAWGLQPAAIEGSAIWVLPNPSGRNRAFRLDHLVDAYRQLYLAIGRPMECADGESVALIKTAGGHEARQLPGSPATSSDAAPISPLANSVHPMPTLKRSMANRDADASSAASLSMLDHCGRSKDSGP
jgi:double-stranded uracil-DNA glycosylase